MAEIPIREAAFAAIAATLAAAALTSGDLAVTVERNRPDDVAEEERPRLVLMDGDQDPEGGDALEARYACRAILAGYLAGGTVAEVATATNLLHAQAVRALIRPGGAGIATPIPLGDGVHEIWISEGPMRVELATVLDSEAPFASFTMALVFDLRSPWGSPFITVP